MDIFVHSNVLDVVLHGVTLVRAILVIIALVFLSFTYKLIRHRLRIIVLQRRGLPMPPYHPLFGHLGLAAKIVKTLPSDAHGHYLATEIKKLYPDLPAIFYLDVWPTGPPLIVITSTEGAAQIIQEPKHEDILGFLGPLIGKHGLVTMEGQEWKYWRNIFNPGFNPSHLSTLVPGIDAWPHCRGTQLNAQRSGSELVSAFRSQASWIPKPNEMNPLKRFNPLRHVIYRYNRWRMDRFVSQELDKRFAEHDKSNSLTEESKKDKPVVNLALETYLSERPSTASPRMDATFHKFALSQMKLFLFAGYDTTASTIVYAIHLLSNDTTALQKLCDELDAVLGPDGNQTTVRISEQPQLLSRLPYTSAVIKEALRLYPPVSNTRKAGPGFRLHSEDGTAFETEGFMLWGVHQAIHRSDEYWPDPNSFKPERWLVAPEHPLYPVKGAWRPFEKGPRNCIGQELALLEAKVVLAMVMRSFDFRDAYAEYDRINGRTGSIVDVHGDRAYQVLLGS
ncbi:MAG: hypothetical protein Q9217_002960, partial [Psora testacea]